MKFKTKELLNKQLVTKTPCEITKAAGESWCTLRLARGNGRLAKWVTLPAGTKVRYVGLVDGNHIVDVPGYGQRRIENFDPFV